MRQVSSLFLFLALTTLLVAQGTPGEYSVECAVCHLSFEADYNSTENLAPTIDTPKQIQGRPAHITLEKMCYTCHDGTIKESRTTFASTNHRAGLDISHMQVEDFPLSRDGEVYCGTCHSPHSLVPTRKGGFAPFLRFQKANSEICLQCHPQNATTHLNHPIHVAQLNRVGDVSLPTFGGLVECLTCHPIHGEKPVRLVENEDRTELCASCHARQTKQIPLTDHDLREKKYSNEAQSKDVCAGCHRTHHGESDFMWSRKIQTPEDGNGFCLSCHDRGGIAGAKVFRHQGHPYRGLQLATAVPALGLQAGAELNCTSCHDPHQWEFGAKHQVTQANEEGTEYTSFLKLPDDAQGQLCVACHPERGTLAESDHSVVREGFQQYFRSAGNLRGQCSVCHNMHGTDYQVQANSGTDPDTKLCLGCHNDTEYPTSVAHINHPMGMKYQSREGLPGSGETGEQVLTCTTCHDPHRWGRVQDSSLTADLIGTDHNSFLRLENWERPDLCLDCHPEQESILGTDHDLPTADDNACSACHTPHNAVSAYGLFSDWKDTPENSFNQKLCFRCHQEGGLAQTKIPPAYEHPRQYGTLAPPARQLGDWLRFPLFRDDGPSMTVGHIDCFTCHDPHRWSYRVDLAHPDPGTNVEGDDLSSFLRNPSKQTLCTDCHGQATLWKYNYFHDPNKRKRY